jgi:NAD(P)-dependent dehydrogenase (short-subunit alcohol dehydrogenase family)
MREFKNKVAVVTGAASGIGLALAQKCAAEGMRVVLADVEAGALDQAARSMADATILPYKVDVSDPDAVETMAEAVYKQFRAVNLLFNNAGVAPDPKPSWAQSLDTWKWLIGVNFCGVIHGLRSFVPRMLAGGQEGHIVNTASVAGLSSGAMISPYFATKHAVVALSESLSLELQMAQANIGASVLCPAFVKTKIGESQRNRPGADAANSAPVSSEFAAMVRALIETGVPPDSIAEKVFEAIQANQFWILTRPDYDPIIKGRGDAILARKNPSLTPAI